MESADRDPRRSLEIGAHKLIGDPRRSLEIRAHKLIERLHCIKYLQRLAMPLRVLGLRRCEYLAHERVPS